MHVKCIHDLCSLLGHILSYLIVYEDLDLFAIDYFLPFGFNIVKQISLILNVFDFQGLSERQTDLNFLPCHFFGK
jgi:hypothetical protein